MISNLRILKAMLWASLFSFTVALPAMQSAAKKNPDSKPASNNQPKAPLKVQKTSLRITVTAQGLKKLPSGSTIELNGKDACSDVHGTRNILLGQATFANIPKCTVLLKIFITGFDTKTVTVDLANYQDPMKILVNVEGPPKVQNARVVGP